ncbi:MAG: GNAT family N-acetyltransferase [Armatimonadota bacterium]
MSRTETLTIRPCTGDDFPAVFAVLHQLWPGQELEEERMSRSFATCLAADAGRYLVTEMDGRIVGFCSLSVTHYLRNPGIVGQIDEFVVDESVRRQGVGSRLLEVCVELAKARGCGVLELDSSFHRTWAHGFYEKRGFKKRAWRFSRKLA